MKTIRYRWCFACGLGLALAISCSSSEPAGSPPIEGEAGQGPSGSGGTAGGGGQPENGGEVGAGWADAGAGTSPIAGTAPVGGSSLGGAGSGSGGAPPETSGGATTGGAGGATQPVYGYCSKPCGTANDCCPAGAPDCPGNAYPNNFACVLGACRTAECTTTEDCKLHNPKTDCVENDGFNSCALACAIDDDCQEPQTCSGVDDNGKKFCLAKGGDGCSDDESCHGYGKCVDKLCVCESPKDCSSATFSACAL